MDREFAMLLILSSYPLRRLASSDIPSGSCSGAVVETASGRVLLTASHSMAPDEPWVVEVRYEPEHGTKLWRLGAMDFVIAIGLNEPPRDLDFAFRSVPADLRSYFQHFSESGALLCETERVILRSDLSGAPKAGCKYGFAGVSRVAREPRPPALSHEILGGELQVETGLAFVKTEGDFDYYSLGHNHPGDSAYQGCSGAPILSEEAELVGPVLGGCEADSTIRSLPLRLYASAVAAGLQPRGAAQLG